MFRIVFLFTSLSAHLPYIAYCNHFWFDGVDTNMNHPVRGSDNTGVYPAHIDMYKPIIWKLSSLFLLLFVDSVDVLDLRGSRKNSSQKSITNHVYLPGTHHSSPCSLPKSIRYPLLTFILPPSLTRLRASHTQYWWIGKQRLWRLSHCQQY